MPPDWRRSGVTFDMRTLVTPTCLSVNGPDRDLRSGSSSTDRMTPSHLAALKRYVPGMRMQGRVTRAVVMTGFVVATAAGCTGTPEVSPTSTPEPTINATPSPTPDLTEPSPTASSDVATPPERPAVMDQPSADGAAAAGVHFLRLHYYMFATGDSAEFEQLSGPDCGFCDRRSNAATTMHQAGNHAESDVISVDDVEGVEILALESYSASFRMREPASREVTASGEVVSSSDGGAYDVLVALTWSDGWRVEAVDITQGES